MSLSFSCHSKNTFELQLPLSKESISINLRVFFSTVIMEWKIEPLTSKEREHVNYC